MDDENLRMTGREAILYVSENYDTKSMYAIAKQLSNEKTKVHTVQISNYLKRGTRMTRKIADRFLQEYNITITDVYDKSAVRRNYHRGM